MTGHLRRRTVVAMLAALVAAPAAAAQGPAAPAIALELPRPTGPHAIGAADLHLVDPARADPWRPEKRRELMVTVWYPARPGKAAKPAPYMAAEVARQYTQIAVKPLGVDPARVDLASVRTHAFAEAPAARGRFPVVLYSPGGNQLRSLGTTLTADLASRGYVVVAIDHTHEAPAVAFPGGRIEGNAVARTPDALKRMIEARVADARFVADALAAVERKDRRLPAGVRAAMDLSRLGAFGHSAGGFTSLEAMSQDRRFAAGADLDGSLAFSMSRAEYGAVVQAGLDRPFLLFGAGVIGPQRRPHTHEGSPEWKRLWERSRGWKRDIYIAKAEHMSFADHSALLPQIVRQAGLPPLVAQVSLGTADPARVIAAQRAYLAAFFDQHLKGRRQRLLDAASAEHPDVTFVP